MSQKSWLFFSPKELCHVTSDIRLLCVTRKIFIGVTVPKIRLNKTHGAIWYEFFNYVLFFVPWPNWSNSIWGSCVWVRPAMHRRAEWKDNVHTWLVQERRRIDCSSLDLEWFELQRIMSLQISVFYIKLDWPRRLHTWLTFQAKFSKGYYQSVPSIHYGTGTIQKTYGHCLIHICCDRDLGILCARFCIDIF